MSKQECEGTPEQLAKWDKATTCCAHRRVIYVQVLHGSGARSSAWECADCRQEFAPLIRSEPSFTQETAPEVEAGLGAQPRRGEEQARIVARGKWHEQCTCGARGEQRHLDSCPAAQNFDASDVELARKLYSIFVLALEAKIPKSKTNLVESVLGQAACLLHTEKRFYRRNYSDLYKELTALREVKDGYKRQCMELGRLLDAERAKLKGELANGTTLFRQLTTLQWAVRKHNECARFHGNCYEINV